MKTIIEWLKPGARVKRYMVMQILSIVVLIFCLVSLKGVYDLNKNMLIAYIFLITLSAFGIIFSFVLAQKNILFVSLKNISRKNKNIKLRKLLYSDPRLRRGPRVVVIGGGTGFPNLLKGLKAFTSNITAVINVSEDDETISSALSRTDYLTTGDIRKCIAALSISEPDIAKILTYKPNINGFSEENSQSVGNIIIASLAKISGTLAKGIEKLPEIFKMQGNIYPVTTDSIVLCAGLENGEVVVGKNNIIERVKELRCQIKQIFLKEGSVKAHPEVIEAIRSANVIVLGPGPLYTSVASNLLIDDVSKAIAKSRAKKVFVANIMNQPGQTDGYTLARYINEIERYIGKHVLDYAIVNNGEITPEMIKDFNQENSTPVRIDLENISNRAICVVQEDLVLTAKDAIIHDCDRLAEIIMSVTKSKKVGNLNIVKVKKRHMRKEKMLKNKGRTAIFRKNGIKARKDVRSKLDRPISRQKELKIQARTQATIDKMKRAVKKG